jgi:hypothetical protein
MHQERHRARGARQNASIRTSSGRARRWKARQHDVDHTVIALWLSRESFDTQIYIHVDLRMKRFSRIAAPERLCQVAIWLDGRFPADARAIRRNSVGIMTKVLAGHPEKDEGDFT